MSVNGAKPNIAIVALGDMGSWVARRLVPHGVQVSTVLAGRSAASAERAAAAGVVDAGSDAALVDGADIILSIVPPAAALALAERLRPVLSLARAKPVFVDCNAISRTTMRQIETCIGGTGCAVVDAAIFGSAPPGDGPGPRIYLSGPEAHRLASLRDHGLAIEILDAPVGSASALKCCFAAIGKGVVALGAEAVIAASQAGVADALHHELWGIFPELAQVLHRLLPESYGKAYRWVAEMEEIAVDFQGVPGGPASFAAAARLFAAIADAAGDRSAEGNLIGALDRFVEHPVPGVNIAL